MGYVHGDSFPLDFEPNRIPFGSKLKEKLSKTEKKVQMKKANEKSAREKEGVPRIADVDF